MTYISPILSACVSEPPPNYVIYTHLWELAQPGYVEAFV